MADIPVLLAAINTFAATNLGTAITLYEPDPADTITVANSGGGFYLLVNNIEAALTATFTFTCPGTTSNLAVPVDDYVVVVAAGTMRQLGPFLPVATFNTSTNVIATVTGTFTGGNVQVACITA